MPVLLAVVAFLALVLVCDRSRRRADWRRTIERDRLHALFTRFVEANRTRPMSESNIDRFLADTAEVESLFRGSALPRLRLELHDQALRLWRLNVALENGWGGIERRAVITEGRAERQAWFARTAASLDALFAEPLVAPIERFNRVIRA